MTWCKVSDTGSWHVVDVLPTEDELGYTLCGRIVARGTSLEKDFRATERTCETCLRISASEDD